MERDTRADQRDPQLRRTDLKEIGEAYIKLAVDYPVWTGITLLSEFINATDIILKASQGVSYGPEEIRSRITLASLIGFFGGGIGESIVRASKFIITKTRN